MLLLQQMMILFFIMLLGLLCRKCGILSKEGSRVISALVVNVANPALILSASINKETVMEGKNLLYAVLLAIGVYVFLLVICILLPFLFRIPVGETGTYKVMTVFSNIGFMGFPVISAVYGSEALLYASIFLLPYNFLIYTWGIAALSGKEKKYPDNPKVSSKQPGNNHIDWKKICNVGVMACIITILIYVTKIPVPYVVESVVTSVSNLTAPLSMMVIGASMADMNLKKLFTNARLLLFCLFKLVIVPIVGVWLIRMFGLTPALTGICMVMLATPVGSMTAMLAQQYEGDYELASQGVALSTLLSVATMPFVSFVLGI